jgi:hypothetical protein
MMALYWTLVGGAAKDEDSNLPDVVIIPGKVWNQFIFLRIYSKDQKLLFRVAHLVAY